MNVRGTVALVSLLSIVGCAEKASEIATGSLSGTAKYAGQSDHSGISVTAGGFSTTTDAAGNYVFGALPLGSYSVQAVAPRSAERTLWATATVNSGANTAPAITFTPVQALAGQLTAMGAPAAGATVTLDGGATATTDANGIYQFASAGEGTHSLSFAAGGLSDSIPTVLYSAATGATVPATWSYGQLYTLQPFDLQGAKRLTSVNVKVPVSRSVYYAPTLSPDGAYYFYGISNDQGRASLFVGAVAGGAPVLVTTDAYPTTSTSYQPKFSTGATTTHLAYVRYNGSTSRYELVAVAIGAGPTIGAAKTLSTIFQPGQGWEYSPQTTATPSIYFIEQDPTSGVYTLREATIDGGSPNFWDGVTSFWMSRKVKRVVFQQALAPSTNRLVSVAATGASVGTTVITYESSTSAFSMNWYGFSSDETRFAYSILSGALTLGLKTAMTGSATVVLISAADTSAGCFTFNPAGTRIAWYRGSNSVIYTSPVASANVVQYSAGTIAYVCQVFTDDDRIWLSYYDGAYKLALAPADASAAPTVFEPNLNDLQSVAFGRAAAVYTRGSGNTVNFWGRSLAATASTQFDTATDYGYLTFIATSGVGALYQKRDYSLGNYNYPYVVYWVGLGGATPTTAQIAPYYNTVTTSTDASKALVWTYEEAGNYRTVTSVDMATGAKKALLRRVYSTSTARLQDLGSPLAPKFVGFRSSSAMPYEFQDGVYVADP